MEAIINESDFNEKERFLTVKFWATWCGPCKLIEPSIKKMEDEFGSVKFVSVDIDQVSSLVQKYRIRSVPSILFLKNGEEVNRLSGSIPPVALKKALEDLTKE
jgi:thioredoxin 1